MPMNEPLLHTLVAHGYIGPGKGTLVVFTWGCHLVPLLAVILVGALSDWKWFTKSRWDWANAVLPFAVLYAASELRRPSIAGFFFNGIILGVVVALAPCIRTLTAKTAYSKSVAKPVPFVVLVFLSIVALALGAFEVADRFL